LARLVELHARGWRGLVIEPGSPAGTLVRPLRDLHGIEVHEVTTGEFALACQSLYDAHLSDLAHSDDDAALDAAAAAVVKRKRADGFLFDRSGDITPLTAAALARWGHLEISEEAPVSVYEGRGLVSL
jgi:hypothetical protein